MRRDGPRSPSSWTMPLERAADAPVALVGGKAHALGRLLAEGLPAPAGLVVTSEAYRSFTGCGGLAERIAVELARKEAEDYRWEELWDASLRIRSWFLGGAWPSDLRAELERRLAEFPPHDPVVVRSSSPHEDARERSFAGMHESVVGVVGRAGVLEAVRSVWASLFSDRSLLYRHELGLDPVTSTMAVIVQPLATSERSGVAFTQDPIDYGRGAIEAVWGLGEGLVSGQVAPDRWSIERASGRVLAHHSPEERGETMSLTGGGATTRTALVRLDPSRMERPPLGPGEVALVWSLAARAEAAFGSPQDCEWTYHRGTPLLTQSRPITTLPDDDRRAYLDLRPSYDRLAALWRRIEGELLPAMRAEADGAAAADLAAADTARLLEEAEARAESVDRWRRVYREEFVPFAHGARLFGLYYNDTVRPADPFEFVSLLTRDASELDTHGALLAELGVDQEGIPPATARREEAERDFLAIAGTEGDRRGAADMLELGRASWRLRDDDNLYLRRVEMEAGRALAEIERRLAAVVLEHGDPRTADGRAAAEAAALDEARTMLASLMAPEADRVSLDRDPGPSPGVRPRQLLGQPAGPGVATGPARVIRGRADLLALRPEDIVVADALEPDTAAFAARAAGIVERRGGMLVHGAIVAREHGLPCVTGVPGAVDLIRDGEIVTVDGHLGIVVLGEV